MVMIKILIFNYLLLFMMMVLHRVIYGEFASLKWEYFIPLWGLLLFITDEH